MKLILAALLLVLATATPAAAHVYTYCGHGIHWHWTARSEYVKSFVDSSGRHRHKIYVADGLLGRYWTAPACPKH